MPMFPLFHLQSPLPLLGDETRDRDQTPDHGSGFFGSGLDGGEPQPEERR